MRHRLHSLGLPHTATNKDYLNCAFTQKCNKGNQMFHDLEHEVIHYGNEASETDCTEHVTVTTMDDIQKAYGDKDYGKHFYDHDGNDHAYQTFHENAVPALRERLQENDIILCWFGTGHMDVAYAAIEDVPFNVHIVEPGIGYPQTFAPNKVYESYAKMHVDIGGASMAHDIFNKLEQQLPGIDAVFPNYRRQPYTTPNWHDTVIPNYFDPKDFDFRPDHDGYYMYIGRIINTKGVEVAMRLADKMGKKLIVAGQGDFFEEMGFEPWDCVELVGSLGVEERRYYMAGAELGICASWYPDPFCGTHMEFLMSGTPILTTDWGVFPETVPHGIVGFRCRTFNYFVEAARTIHEINPAICRTYAEQNFGMERVSLMFNEYFDNIVRIAENPDNFWAIGDKPADLDMLRRPYPMEMTRERMETIRKRNRLQVQQEREIAAAVDTQLHALLENADDPAATSAAIMQHVRKRMQKTV